MTNFGSKLVVGAARELSGQRARRARTESQRFPAALRLMPPALLL